MRASSTDDTHKVMAEKCENCKQIAHTRLESIVGAENPYSLNAGV
jgi:hypothetical protein